VGDVDESRVKAAAYFQDRTMVPDNPTQSAAMRVTLEPAELLSITGTASDSQGKPLPEAEVYLFGGIADDKWVKQVNPTGSGIVFPENYRLLAGVRADKEGHFTFWALRHDASANEAGAATFSVGLYTKENSELVTGVQVAKGAKTRAVTVQLKGN
jgi:protocatechuate 3,4-dioxygenase beta subunit